MKALSVDRITPDRDPSKPCAKLRLGAESFELSVREADDLIMALQECTSDWFNKHKGRVWFFDGSPTVVVDVGHGLITSFDLHQRNDYIPATDYERKMLLLALEEAASRVRAQESSVTE